MRSKASAYTMSDDVGSFLLAVEVRSSCGLLTNTLLKT